MNKYIWLSILLLGCNQSPDLNTDTPYPIPDNAIIREYDHIPDLYFASFQPEDGIVEEGDVLEGLRHGIWTRYFKTGKVEVISAYHLGLKNGPQIQFDDSGYIISKSNFENDLLEGDYRIYHRGQILERRTYRDGEMNGLFQKYYRDGTIMEESYYKDGVMHGTGKWYDAEGKLAIQYEYENGELVGGFNAQEADSTVTE